MSFPDIVGCTHPIDSVFDKQSVMIVQINWTKPHAHQIIYFFLDDFLSLRE